MIFSEEIWNDCQHSPMEKTLLTNEDVFTELVSQRLAQGFNFTNYFLRQDLAKDTETVFFDF